MGEIIQQIKWCYADYIGDEHIWIIFLLSLLILFAFNKKYERKFLKVYLILFIIIYACPVTAKLLMDYGMGRDVYWRMFWLVPIPFVIACAVVELINHIKPERKKLATVATMVIIFLFITLDGFMYLDWNFQKYDNWYKVPGSAVRICQIINQDAEENKIENKKVVVPNELVSYIRQVDATIEMPYGRNVLKGETIAKRDQNVYDNMNDPSRNIDIFVWNLKVDRCNYLVLQSDESTTKELNDRGYILIGDTDGYKVFRCNDVESLGWKITEYGDSNGLQLNFYTIENENGYLIVVDGGWIENAEQVRSVIEEHGNKVNAWILTHPHKDHIGAFNSIYQNLQGIEIEKVYTTDMASPQLCQENASWDSTEAYEEFLSLNVSQLEYLYPSDKLELDGLKLEVFSAYTDKVDELSKDLLNDGSLMFKITGKNQSMLFCADVGKSMSKYLLNKYDDELSADYLQMGHHGNGGLSKEFYKKVNPKVAVFDAPDWLFNDTTGKYTSAENRKIMEDIGAEVISFLTAPNVIVLK